MQIPSGAEATVSAMRHYFTLIILVGKSLRMHVYSFVTNFYLEGFELNDL